MLERNAEAVITRLPEHVGIIPDGNRRWSEQNGMPKEKGYENGIDPGLTLLKLCQQTGIKEVTYYGFTTDNTKRPAEQKRAFTDACIKAVEILSAEDASLLVLGNTDSSSFPRELIPFTKRRTFGKGGIKVNFLVNYGWEWDLNSLKMSDSAQKKIINNIKSAEVSRIDLIIRWGGCRRLSGFLPVQSIYADFYVLDDYWPDFKPEHFYQALSWYQEQDITLGG
ncbi:MAG: di-trans,poly-cis-decaprenylcistransferase [Candidatus Omnitrophica bacterium]|nr:di-trans,poly-cis-decaprenylcistransferase [Candidatus Omnitrophota bacterium]